MSDFITNAELRIEAERLCDENEHLQAENARLRSELESVGTAAYLYGRSDLKTENAKLRELCEKLYGYYVSGTLVPCDFCDRYDCEGNAPTTCKADEYEPDGIVAKEIERLMRKLGVEV